VYWDGGSNERRCSRLVDNVCEGRRVCQRLPIDRACYYASRLVVRRPRSANEYSTRGRLFDCTQFSRAGGEPLVLSPGSGETAQLLVLACPGPAAATRGNPRLRRLNPMRHRPHTPSRSKSRRPHRQALQRQQAPVTVLLRPYRPSRRKARLCAARQRTVQFQTHPLRKQVRRPPPERRPPLRRDRRN
jgi:hypothetical protein